MKIPKHILSFAFLALILIAAAAFVIAFLPKFIPVQPTLAPTSAVLSKIGTPPQQPSLVAGSTVFPLPTSFPGAQWSQAPSCTNQPQASDAVTQALLASPSPSSTPMDLRRAMLLSPKLAQLQPAEMNAVLAADSPEASAQKALLGLAVNLATGRINRATEVSFQDLPDIKTAGDLLDRLEEATAGALASPAVLQAARDVQSGKSITGPVCARLLMTKAGSGPDDLRWNQSGVSAQALTAQGFAASSPGQRPGPAIDTVTTSPDGRRAAFTSVGNDAGGPIFLLDLKSGETTNLMDKANALQGQPPLAPDGWWDLIGWMPDSQRLVIGSADASAVFIIDSSSGKYQAVPLKGGLGSAQFIGLSPDGSQVAFIATPETGSEQALNTLALAGGQISTLVRFPTADGTLFYPRFSPDGRFLAYVVQKGQPQTGLTYAIMLYGFEKGLSYVVAEGNLGLTVPTWSPDGQYLAFTRKNVDEPDITDPNKPFDQPGVNIWVASMTTGKLEQVTFVNGTARRPVWNSDARTISFITHDGQVGLVNVDRPGKIWLAAESSPLAPEFTSVFFVP